MGIKDTEQLKSIEENKEGTSVSLQSVQPQCKQSLEDEVGFKTARVEQFNLGASCATEAQQLQQCDTSNLEQQPIERESRHSMDPK